MRLLDFATQLIWPPRYFVRLCSSRAEFLSVLSMVLTDKSASPDAIEKLNQTFMSGDAEASIFGAETNCVFDAGHALGVLASTLGQKDFGAERGKKRKSSTTYASLILPAKLVRKHGRLKHSPEGNMCFAPANARHYDFTPHSADAFASALAKEILSGEVRWTVSDAQRPTFAHLATVALSWCCREHRTSLREGVPGAWFDNKNLAASEQVDRLLYVAGVALHDSPGPS